MYGGSITVEITAAFRYLNRFVAIKSKAIRKSKKEKCDTFHTQWPSKPASEWMKEWCVPKNLILTRPRPYKDVSIAIMNFIQVNVGYG